MNRDEILNTPVGPELDRLVARIKWGEPVQVDGWGQVWYRMPKTALPQGMTQARYWSTNIGAAWELVEEMREKGIQFVIFSMHHIVHAHKWEGDSDNIAETQGEQDAEAITRAYLLAKLEEE